MARPAARPHRPTPTWTCRPRSCRSPCGSTSATSPCAHAEGDAAPWFGFVANIEAEDGGATIIAGNERVLRARFADARHFWDLDRKTPLADRVPALDAITFHAKLGTPGRARAAAGNAGRDRSRRCVGADPALADRAARTRQGRPRDRHGGRVPRTAGRDGPLLRAARRRGPAGRRRDPRSLRAARARTTRCPRRRSRSPSRWPTSSINWPASSRSARSRPAPATPMRCAGPRSGVIRIIRENGLRLRLAPSDRALLGRSLATTQRRLSESSTSSSTGCACSFGPRARGTMCSHAVFARRRRTTICPLAGPRPRRSATLLATEDGATC